MTGSNPLQERLAAVRAPRQPAATHSAASPARPVGGTPAARGARKPIEQRWDNRVHRATYYIDTEILVSEAYKWAFVRGQRYGYAAAYAVLIFGILLLASRALGRAGGAEGGADDAERGGAA